MIGLGGTVSGPVEGAGNTSAGQAPDETVALVRLGLLALTGAESAPDSPSSGNEAILDIPGGVGDHHRHLSFGRIAAIGHEGVRCPQQHVGDGLRQPHPNREATIDLRQLRLKTDGFCRSVRPEHGHKVLLTARARRSGADRPRTAY